MRTRICQSLNIDLPIVGFTPSPEVAAAISRAGGFGVLGAIRYTTVEELAAALDWMDANVGGRPYGLDIVMPAKHVGGEDLDALGAMIDDRHKQFVQELLARFGVPPLPPGAPAPAGINAWVHARARAQLEVAWRHPIKLLANALGPPPADVIEEAHARGVLVAALAGKGEHARAHRAAGVDIVVAQGHEAGGHTGEITTMVLVPEVVAAVEGLPVLAAGGIGTGAQVAAALALGAEGVWTGSVWLTSAEYKLEPGAGNAGYGIVKEKLLAATSSDTVRSRVISGKPARMLRTEWTDAWEASDSPGRVPQLSCRDRASPSTTSRMPARGLADGAPGGEIGILSAPKRRSKTRRGSVVGGWECSRCARRCCFDRRRRNRNRKRPPGRTGGVAAQFERWQRDAIPDLLRGKLVGGDADLDVRAGGLAGMDAGEEAGIGARVISGAVARPREHRGAARARLRGGARGPPYDFRQALVNSEIGAVMALSLVLITGFVGQIRSCSSASRASRVS